MQIESMMEDTGFQNPLVKDSEHHSCFSYKIHWEKLKAKDISCSNQRKRIGRQISLEICRQVHTE